MNEERVYCVGTEERSPGACLCSHRCSWTQRTTRSLAAPSSYLHNLRGLGTGFSYFLTMTSWVRCVISWARKGKAPCGCVTEGEHCPAGAGFPLV